MTLGLILLWIAGVLLMAGLIELWFWCERTASHFLLQVSLEIGAVFAFFTPLVLALVPGAVLWGLVRLTSPPLFQRVVKPAVKRALRLARRNTTDPVVEQLVAEHQCIHAEQQAIDQAMQQTKPGDPALLGRIEKLTAEAESLDRAVLGRLNRQAAHAFGTEETTRLWQRLWRHEHRPKPRRLVGVGLMLLVLAGIGHFVAAALTQRRHHRSYGGSAEATFRQPGLSGYTSGEVVSMVEHKASEEGVFDAAQESISCPTGSYPVGAVLVCTLNSPKGSGNFDVEVTQSGISPVSLDHTRCALYTPGHRTHVIQAKLARDDDPAKYRHGRVVSVADDGWITVEVDGERLCLWNHDPEWVRRCLKESGGQVGLPGWHLLHARHARGRYCICVSDDGPTPCCPPSTAGSSPAGLFEQLLTHGGFLVSGAEVARHLDDSRDDNARP